MLYDNFLNDRIEDMFISADRKVSLRYTSFLDCSQVTQAEKYIASIKKLYPQVKHCFWGGYDGAERKILCVYNIYLDINLVDFPLKIVEFKYSTNFSKLTHRDFLGSIMALKIQRHSIGDIIVGFGKTQVIANSTVADIILTETTCICRVGVKTSLADSVSVEAEQNFKDISGTVASLRLDCVLGLALNVSRNQTVQIVKSKVVCINYFEETSPDTLLKLGDIITVKGYGKFILDNVSEPTKKNRLHILIRKYL